MRTCAIIHPLHLDLETTQIIGTLNRARQIDIFGDAADRRLQLTLGTSRDVIVGERQNGETGKELRRLLFEHITGFGGAQRGIRGDGRRSAHAQPPDDHPEKSTADTDRAYRRSVTSASSP